MTFYDIDPIGGEEVLPRDKRDVEIREDSPFFSNSMIPKLSARNAEVLDVSNVKLVLHPLYEMLFQNKGSFDMELWSEASRESVNIDKPAGVLYVEKWIVKQANLMILESSSGGVSMRIQRIIEMYQEYESLIDSNPVETTIYVLPDFQPSSITGIPEEAYEVLVDIMTYYANDRSVFLESQEWSNGHLSSSDQVLLSRALRGDVSIEISGGYIGKCMTNLTDDLERISTGKNWSVTINAVESTPVMFFEDHLGIPGVLGEGFPRVNFGGFTEFKSMDDVRIFLTQNENFVSYYNSLMEDHLQ